MMAVGVAFFKAECTPDPPVAMISLRLCMVGMALPGVNRPAREVASPAERAVAAAPAGV